MALCPVDLRKVDPILMDKMVTQRRKKVPLLNQIANSPTTSFLQAVSPS
jgi:hypothetical protein